MFVSVHMGWCGWLRLPSRQNETNEEITDDGDGPAEGASMLLTQSRRTSRLTLRVARRTASTPWNSAPSRPAIHSDTSISRRFACTIRWSKACYRLTQGF